jgi:alanine dehydrogenase
MQCSNRAAWAPMSRYSTQSEALRRVDAVLGNRVRTLFSTCDVVELLSPRADLVIATVLVPGSTAPKLSRRLGMLSSERKSW